MIPEQLAALTASVSKVFDANAEGKAFCATITANGDERCWIQVTRTELNVAYPHARDPASFVAEVMLPSWAALSLLDWEANNFATFEFSESLSAENVAMMADALLVALAGANADHAVTVEVFELPA